MTRLSSTCIWFECQESIPNQELTRQVHQFTSSTVCSEDLIADFLVKCIWWIKFSIQCLFYYIYISIIDNKYSSEIRHFIWNRFIVLFLLKETSACHDESWNVNGQDKYSQNHPYYKSAGTNNFRCGPLVRGMPGISKWHNWRRFLPNGDWNYWYYDISVST